MKVKVYNLEGKQTGEIELSDAVFNAEIKPEVVHEVLTVYQTNQREPWADAKSRAEVRGGGRKPWSQKGTGRARHGSVRSPLWKGGGVTFGPLSLRNYKAKINKKTRRSALKMCLSDKIKNDGLLVVENFDFSEPKTKLFASFLKALPVSRKKFLVLTEDGNEKVLRASKNLPDVKTIRVQDLNIADILSKPVVVASKAGITKIEENLKK